MKIVQFLKKIWHRVLFICRLPLRNRLSLDNKLITGKKVNLEWVDNHNLGDSLGPLIYQWMLDKKEVSVNASARKLYHLFSCGSLVGVGSFDAVVWGSGIHTAFNIHNLFLMRRIRRYDIRAVRGPVTRQAFLDCGYDCPEVYGDPAIIMPLIFDEECSNKEFEVSVILHYYLENSATEQQGSEFCHYIDIGTTDYKEVIREMKASKKVISSSLHGIILAETYGVPAVFLNTGGYVERALMKYYDWYYSTNRWNVKMAKSLEEAIEMEPMPLPELTEMRSKLMDAFPYDLWE